MTRGARTARLAAAAVAVAALALSAAGCGGGGDEPPAATGTTTAVEVPTVRVVGGRPEGGPIRVAGRRGDTLRFAVVSNRAAELHVHGYDALWALAPGERVIVTIRADLEGIFEAELHGSGELVARLVVEP